MATRKLRIAAVAARLDVSAATVRAWIRDGILPAIKPRRLYLIDERDIAEFEHRARTSAQPPAAE